MKTNKITPLTFDLVDLPEEGLELEGTVTPEELGLEDEPGITFDRPVAFRLHLAPVNAAHDLLVRGRAETTVTRPCDRCNEPADCVLAAEDICHEYENAFGGILDLTDDIREDILCVLPQHFYCREDCKGFCLKCGQNLNLGECGCEPDDEATPTPESPWDCLDALKNS